MTTHRESFRDDGDRQVDRHGDILASLPRLNGSAPPTASANRVQSAGKPQWRLRKHTDYQQVYKQGRKQFGQLLTYFYVSRTADIQTDNRTPSDALLAATRSRTGPRIGLTAGKVLGGAVDRNRIKRRMREAVRHQLHVLTAECDVVLHPKRSVLDTPFERIEREVARVFSQVEMSAHAPRNAPRLPSPVASKGGPDPAVGQKHEKPWAGRKAGRPQRSNRQQDLTNPGKP